MTAFVHWNVNPEIFHIGPLSVRWYGLLFAASFYFGYILFTRFFKLEKIPIEVLDKLTIYMAVGTIVGARLGHCFFYEPKYYLSNPWEILAIWHGGLASHGAAVGILIAIYYFSKKEKKPFLWTMDRIVIVGALSGFFIRLGNLMNSEIYGVATDLPWGFIFVRENEKLPKHPTQIYESLAYLLIFILLLRLYYKANGKPKAGMIFGLFFILVFSFRFFVEFIKNEQVDFEKGMALNMGQILSIPIVIAGIVLLWRGLAKPAPVDTLKNNTSK
ncbi:MAG TPA: prolipoprotein diacylglyceryl transferase [Bacteroidales bacterium]|nr:prolipoprotein diacylglyceryl transferase [Bacteroidales bacterium]